MTGIRILRSQQQVIPWGNLNYLIANDRRFSVDVGDELTESKLVILTYNTDIYNHSHYLYATITDMPLQGLSPAQNSPIVATALLTSTGVPLSSAAGG